MSSLRNGIIVTVDNGIERTRYVWQEREDDEDADLRAFAEVLWQLIDDYSPGDRSRYSKARIRLRIEPGDKFEELPGDEGYHVCHAANDDDTAGGLCIVCGRTLYPTTYHTEDEEGS